MGASAILISSGTDISLPVRFSSETIHQKTMKTMDKAARAAMITVHHDLRFVPQIWFLWSESMPSQRIVEGF